MTRTILLADDSVTIQKVVELTFMDEDFRVVSVGSGTEAIERLAEIAPDIVIADVHMPGADGYEVAERVRASRPGTPVLLLAGTFEVFDQERADGVGASANLKKPFDSQELLRRVRELIENAPAPTAAPAAYSAQTSEVPALATEAGEWAAVEEAPEIDESVSWSVESAPIEIPAEISENSPIEVVEVPEVSYEEPEALAFEPVAEPEPLAPVAAAAAAMPSTRGASVSLSDEDVERIARRIAEVIGDRVVREVAWEVVPDLAEVLLKARIRELESSVE